MRMRYHRFTRLLQDSNGDFTGNTGKVAQELIQRLTCFEIVEEVLHGHARLGEHWRAPLNLWINRNEFPAHAQMIRRRLREG